MDDKTDLEHFEVEHMHFGNLYVLQLMQASPPTSPPPIKSSEERALVWKQDLRIVPLSAAIYLLCYLDRSNIGNAKTLNASTKNDLLSETRMTNFEYTFVHFLACCNHSKTDTA